MRRAFVQSLIEVAEQDERIVLLTADLGFMVLEPFRNRFPDRFINVGVMEQNMIGVATGLAMNGFIPFAYSIATFAGARPYEFIRNGPMIHNLPVRVVGIGGGVEYAHDGMSHHALEDIALMRNLPSFSIISPSDRTQMDRALKETWNLPGPVYYRISKLGNTAIPKLDGQFKYQEVDLIKTGSDALCIATGPIAYETILAAEQLEKQGISCAVAVISTLQPINERQLLFLLSGYRKIFSFESHYTHGGLGSILAETISQHNLNCTLHRNGLGFTPKQTIGSQEFFYDRYQLSLEKIKQNILNQVVTSS